MHGVSNCNKNNKDFFVVANLEDETYLEVRVYLKNPKDCEAKLKENPTQIEPLEED